MMRLIKAHDDDECSECHNPTKAGWRVWWDDELRRCICLNCRPARGPENMQRQERRRDFGGQRREAHRGQQERQREAHGGDRPHSMNLGGGARADSIGAVCCPRCSHKIIVYSLGTVGQADSGEGNR